MRNRHTLRFPFSHSVTCGLPPTLTLTFVLTLAVGFALPPLGTRTVAAEDWPQWQGARRDSSWFPARLPDPAVPLRSEPLWSSPVGPGYSGIAVVGNYVYTMDRIEERTGDRTEDETSSPPSGSRSEEERVVCLDSRTGKLVWEHRYSAPYGKLDYPKGPRTTPTVHDGRVYTLGAVGHLHCLDATNGSRLWHKDLVGELGAVNSTWGFSSAPVVDADLVIVHAGIPQNGSYVAFDRKTGEERWRSGSDPLGYGTPVIIQHAGQRQLIAWTPEHVLSLNIRNGQENWRIPYKVTYGVSIATPLFAENHVLVCGYWEGSKAIRLGSTPSDATLAWEENRYLRGLMAPPLYRDRHVYLLDKHHGLVCFELATGKKLWTDDNKLTPRDRNPQASLVWLGDTSQILALNTPGELIHAQLTPAGYQEFSRAKIIGETWAHPAFAGDSCFARDDTKIVRVPIIR